MMLSLRARLIAAGLVLAIAGTAAIVLAPTVEQAVKQFERIAHSRGGLAGDLAQQLSTTTTSGSARPGRAAARPAGRVPIARHAGAAVHRPKSRSAVPRDRRPAKRTGGGGLPGWLIAVLVGVGGAGVLALLVAGLAAVRRLRGRARRDYGP